MYAGVKINIDGEEFIVPPLSLGQLRHGINDQLKQHDQLVADGKPFEAYDIRGQIILAALRRNYPDFAEDKLLNYLDVGNNNEVWLAVLGVSGFKPGETQAAMTASINGTSSPSIEVSPQLTDGVTIQ